MTITQHAQFYSFHTSNLNVGEIFLLNLYQYIPYQYADVTWVEKSTKQAANNYGAEILGGCSTQLIVKAAITGHNMVG